MERFRTFSALGLVALVLAACTTSPTAPSATAGGAAFDASSLPIDQVLMEADGGGGAIAASGGR